ncbi:phosphate metabolism protein 8-like [Canna indica]|uniref:Phosphate metabolism protein 8-like n=1 Tax=Canna indica TaxID=4628 RepID=A0AAQ3KGI2_9LILI|nr:phosphate metabolism protein 8-like [Canna indica]
MEFENRCRPAGRPKYDCLLFGMFSDSDFELLLQSVPSSVSFHIAFCVPENTDLDDTLYPLSSGLATSCLKNIGDYMFEKLGIDSNKIPELCNLLYKNYGTTMAGLRAIGYEFDYDEYHSFVHGRLPYENLKPDPVLRQILLSLPIRKVVFTNGDKVHALKVLKRLGLEDCFQGIICFETLNPPSSSSPKQGSDVFDIVDHFCRPKTGAELPKTPILCKPSTEAMDHALRIADIDPERSIFFDDSARNIQSGKRIGLHTVLVGTSRRVKGADQALESIHNIREAFPELWEEAEKSGGVRCSGKVAPETSVIA